LSRGQDRAATPARVQPTGMVTLAFHTFSKEVLDPSLDSAVGLPYRGEMFDWFIGATPEGTLSTATGVLERYAANADATMWTLTLKQGLRWHDGEEITAEDITFTVEYYTRPEAI